MSENKDNPPINLELLERQLREALARRPSEGGQERAGNQQTEDPLAELSRLTGFENPARAEQIQTDATHRQSVQHQVDQSDHYELQAVGDRYGVMPQFSSPKKPQPAPETSYLGGIAPQSSLFQSISVNYGGFQNAPVTSSPQPEVKQSAVQGYQTPQIRPNEAADSTSNSQGSQPFFTPPYHPTESQSYRSFSHPSDPAEPVTQPPVTQQDAAQAYASNPYEKIENSYNSPVKPPAQPQQDPIFESRIFNTLRNPPPEPQPDPQPPLPDRAALHQQEPAWSPQAEQRSALSMSESEAHDDLFNQARQEPKTGSSGKGVYILLGLLALLGGGFGLAAYLRTEGAAVPSGPAPVISADKTPVKVPPADQGNTPNPTQSSTVYQPGKVEDPKEAKIVSNEEKPVDINTVPRPAGAPLLGEPKKIRTVTIRPDGTVVEESAVNSAGSVANVAANPRSGATLAPPPVQSMPSPSASVAQPVIIPAVPAQAQPPAATPPQGPVVRVMPPERPQTIAAAQPSPPPSAPEKPQAAAAPVEKIEAGSGDYGVQFGAPASEAEARTMITNLKKNNAKLFDGLSFVVQKADNSGRTIYRVRVIGLARDGAISLCEKMKSSGSACFVAKN
jgi:LPXTG-motif cell wall-anchored protein